MSGSFLDTPEGLEWLRTTHLRGVPLPAHWQGFAFAVLQGNEDAPHAVNLYRAASPGWYDDYLRVTFVHVPPVYCEYAEHDGLTNKPRGIRVGAAERVS